MNPDRWAEKQYVREHLGEDVSQLALRGKGREGLDMPWVLQQIKGYQTLAKKAPLLAACPDLEMPVGLSLEQASSQATGRFKQALATRLAGDAVSCGCDLTGGLGIDSYFLSESCRKWAYVEEQAELCRLAAHNFPALQRGQIEVHHGSAQDYLRDMTPVDLIYADPARRSDTGEKVSALEACRPNLTEIYPLVLEKSRFHLFKLSPMLDVTEALRVLTHTRLVCVLSVDNECKELLLWGEREPLDSGPSLRIEAVNLSKHGPQCFTYTAVEETEAVVRYADHPGTYLYEPNASLLKAGAFKLPAQRFHLEKLHPNSHLYTGDTWLDDFPGKGYEVEECLNPSAKSTRLLLKQKAKFRVSVRHYPDTAEHLRQRFQVRESDTEVLFATTLADGSHRFILAKNKS